MTTRVHRVGRPLTGRHAGRQTLVQVFAFSATSAETLATLLWTRPLTGAGGLFPNARHRGVQHGDDERVIRGFSPVPGFRFDVTLARAADAPLTFVATLSQPGRKTPYLDGDLVWRLSDAPDGARLTEEVNTPAALAIARPLHGPRKSLRRWLFFRLGHAKVMDGLVASLASLASSA